MEFLWDAWNALYQFVQPADPPYPYSWFWDVLKIFVIALVIVGPLALFVYSCLVVFISWLWVKCGSPSFKKIYLNIAKPLNFVFYYSIGYICVGFFLFEWGADEIDANSIRGIALFIFIAVCISYIKFLGEAIILESKINELKADMTIKDAKEALVKNDESGEPDFQARYNAIAILDETARDSDSHRGKILTILQNYVSTNSTPEDESYELEFQREDIVRAKGIIKWCYDNEPR